MIIHQKKIPKTGCESLYPFESCNASLIEFIPTLLAYRFCSITYQIRTAEQARRLIVLETLDLSLFTEEHHEELTHLTNVNHGDKKLSTSEIQSINFIIRSITRYKDHSQMLRRRRKKRFFFRIPNWTRNSKRRRTFKEM